MTRASGPSSIGMKYFVIVGSDRISLMKLNWRFIARS